MREIKFRAWDIDGEKMRNIDVFHFIKGAEFLQTPKSSGDPEEYTIMQYTGLKDKNGEKIYEKDILIDITDKSAKLVVVNPPCWHDEDAFRVFGYSELTSFIEDYQISEDKVSPSKFIQNCLVVGNLCQGSSLFNRYPDKYKSIIAVHDKFVKDERRRCQEHKNNQY